MQIKEVMTANPACCTPDASLQEVAQMMVDHDCGLIPVVDSHSTMKPVGTITDRDITIRTVATNQNPLDLKASDIMTTGIVNITPEMSVEDCMNVMEDQEIRRVLVVDEKGACCGIVAQADVAQFGMNPNRTARMLREISESAPSRNKQSYGSGQYSSNYGSFMNSDSLLPLLLGVGTGAALMYFLSPERKTERASHFDYTKSSYQPATTNYRNTSHLNNTTTVESGRTQGLKTETPKTMTSTSAPFDEEDTFVKDMNATDTDFKNTEKRRTASPGKSF